MMARGWTRSRGVAMTFGAASVAVHQAFSRRSCGTITRRQLRQLVASTYGIPGVTLQPWCWLHLGTTPLVCGRRNSDMQYSTKGCMVPRPESQ